MPKIKNLYLPGTNKNVGYLNKTTMHLYKRFIKYFPLPQLISSGENSIQHPHQSVIFTQKENKKEKYVELTLWKGYMFDLMENNWAFFDCEFKTPDNLDVVEMSYLFKHWNQKNV